MSKISIFVLLVAVLMCFSTTGCRTTGQGGGSGGCPSCGP